MNVGDIIKKEHYEHNIRTNEHTTIIEEIITTQEMINDKILVLYSEAKTLEEIATEFDRELTEAEIELYNSKVAEATRQSTYKRLDEIDKEVAQARVIDDILKGNPPHQRVIDLLAERESLLNNIQGVVANENCK